MTDAERLAERLDAIERQLAELITAHRSGAAHARALEKASDAIATAAAAAPRPAPEPLRPGCGPAGR